MVSISSSRSHKCSPIYWLPLLNCSPSARYWIFLDSVLKSHHYRETIHFDKFGLVLIWQAWPKIDPPPMCVSVVGKRNPIGCWFLFSPKTFQRSLSINQKNPEERREWLFFLHKGRAKLVNLICLLGHQTKREKKQMYFFVENKHFDTFVKLANKIFQHLWKINLSN